MHALLRSPTELLRCKSDADEVETSCCVVLPPSQQTRHCADRVCRLLSAQVYGRVWWSRKHGGCAGGDARRPVEKESGPASGGPVVTPHPQRVRTAAGIGKPSALVPLFRRFWLFCSFLGGNRGKTGDISDSKPNPDDSTAKPF